MTDTRSTQAIDIAQMHVPCLGTARCTASTEPSEFISTISRDRHKSSRGENHDLAPRSCDPRLYPAVELAGVRNFGGLEYFGYRVLRGRFVRALVGFYWREVWVRVQGRFEG
jgi:hypothetical protein